MNKYSKIFANTATFGFPYQIGKIGNYLPIFNGKKALDLT